MQRRAVVGRARPARRRASRSRPPAAPRSTPARSGPPAGRRAERGERGAEAAVELGRHLARVRALGRRGAGDHDLRSRRRTSRRSRAGSPSARRSRAPRRRPSAPAPRAREKQSSWSAGTQPRASPLRNTGMRSSSHSSLQRVLAVAPVEAGAGHDHRARGAAQELGRAVDRVAVGRRRAGRVGQGGGRVGVHVGLHEHRRRAGSRGRSGPVGGPSAACSASSTSAGISAVDSAVRASRVSGATNGTWSISWSEPWPQRIAGARPPSTSIGEPFWSAEPIALMPLVTPGPGGQRADARLARRLGPALGREGGRLLVAGVDDVDALLAAAVVDREEVAAGEREQLRHAVGLAAAWPPGARRGRRSSAGPPSTSARAY